MNGYIILFFLNFESFFRLNRSKIRFFLFKSFVPLHRQALAIKSSEVPASAKSFGGVVHTNGGAVGLSLTFYFFCVKTKEEKQIDKWFDL